MFVDLCVKVGGTKAPQQVMVVAAVLDFRGFDKSARHTGSLKLQEMWAQACLYLETRQLIIHTVHAAKGVSKLGWPAATGCNAAALVPYVAAARLGNVRLPAYLSAKKSSQHTKEESLLALW